MTDHLHDEHIFDLRIEFENDGCILLEQNDGSGNVERVAIHPSQLRYLAEKGGLVPTHDPEALKTIDTLKRRMKVLRDRIDHLGEYLTLYSDHDHANLDYEVSYITATADIAEEFCLDLDDTGPPPAAPETPSPRAAAERGDQLGLEV